MLEVRLTPKPSPSSSIQAGTLTLCHEKETDASFGTPIHGPWVGLGTCEPAQARPSTARVPGQSRVRPGASGLPAGTGPVFPSSTPPAHRCVHNNKLGAPLIKWQGGQGQGQGLA